MLNSFDSLHLAMFSGKGGVGKSTLSSAFACRWAKQFPNDRILLLSTDPAHSLGDVLQMEVSNTAQTIESLPNLSVRALDAELLLKDFKAEYGEILERLVERGSFVGQGDLASVWELGWSGLDELMGILEIQRLLRDRVVDRIVVDMAPSGHTLALFNLMEFLEEFLSALELFQLKHRTMSEAFTGRYTPDEVDLFLESMRRDLTDGRQLLQDSARSACFVVAIAEWLSLLESQRLIKALEALKIPFGGVFLNQVHAEREELVRKFQEIADPVLTFSQQSQEPIGIAALDRLITTHSEFVPSAIPIAPSQSLPDFILEQRKLILVGGKGGVGKTTVAAAIALNLAQQHPDRKIRVISIDPAHSLGDAFGTQLGHEPTDILPNLSAQEVDARTLLDRFREEYLWELADMMSGKTQDESLQIAYTPEAWRKIMAQALPGIDEMLALLEVMELLESNAQDLIILDTAPTGHLLRFLEMPSVLTDWLTWIFKLWLKYQNVAGHTELMSRLRTLRLRIIKTHKQLQNAEHTEFIGVVQARSTIFAETERLVRSLEPLQIHQRFIVNNRATQRLEEFAGKTVVNLPNAPSDLAPMAQIEKISEWLIAPNSIASLVSFNPQSQI
ncbi:arsenite-activated ATPase ArsA [Leptolyngbya boryana NIES-2135]|jgi:arsenite-transporting ATPase|uniref:Arsenite-activated ATPase ArsA n=1 Tax=Leptolyngbya boryana NIES-2135 TaxID=1973484 RepID=A0A1Z4JMF5_LEPBY|nr:MULTISPECIES: ArsA family ATPase [Leptolyngbya]ULP28903.1 ArsA family ATPase [Leptolyngbya boryana IU 594]BAS56033.1 arsenite-activated ATPase ArsA [Leptolyngbya boryana IAM M-101]BAS62381.1 arsenite-activated ATPase ArsA [Leptolyngbya boryana dg5]BAY57797.1 arsenite-activated ATPase ArsA [Leptolyngbya boryana NIES-2135]